MSDQAGSSSSEQKTDKQNEEKANVSSLNESVAESEANTSANESSVNFYDAVHEMCREEEEREEEALAVLGGSDENYCTFSKGYIKRQALYSCLTCVPRTEDPKQRAGMCLACCLTCHEGHELIELYTKRNFRCDCGNARMKAVRCKLEPIKFGENEENQYNQNFWGVYCTCHKPYPDPEGKDDDEMIQCAICEDWFHSRHLNATVPSANAFAEMVCGQCMDALPFLACYLEHSVDVLNQSLGPENQEVKSEEGQNQEGLAKEASLKSPKEGDSLDVEIVEESAPKRMKLDVCKKGEPNYRPQGAAVFWCDEWRLKLCKCDECLKHYKEIKVEYLIDPEDTVQKYEEKGKSRYKPKSAEEEVNQAISSLGHVEKVYVLTEYNKLKNRLKEFLGAFATNNQVMTTEDVNRFFEMMKSEKNNEEASPQHFCR